MKFGIQKQPKIPTPQEAYNNLIGADGEKIVKLDISLLDELEQPFSVNAEKVQDIAKSISKVGLADPIIVRKNDNERYDILAGRHRVRACKLLGFDKINSIIKDVDDSTARAILLVTNTDRNNEYKPSELAKAYTEYEELIKEMDDKTAVSAQLTEKFKTDRKQIYRYKRLNFLIPELLDMVDDKRLPLLAGVSLSYIDTSSQKKLATYLKRNNRSVTTKEAEILRGFDSSHFYFEALDDFFNPKPVETIIQQPVQFTTVSSATDSPVLFEPSTMKLLQDELNAENSTAMSDKPIESRLPDKSLQHTTEKTDKLSKSRKPRSDDKVITDKELNKKLVSLSEEEKFKIIDWGIFNDIIRGYMLLAAENEHNTQYNSVIELIENITAAQAYEKYLMN